MLAFDRSMQDVVRMIRSDGGENGRPRLQESVTLVSSHSHAEEAVLAITVPHAILTAKIVGGCEGRGEARLRPVWLCPRISRLPAPQVQRMPARGRRTSIAVTAGPGRGTIVVW